MVFIPRRRRLARFLLVVFFFAGCIILFQLWSFDSLPQKFVGRRSESGLLSVKSRDVHVPNVIPKSISLSQYSKTTSATWIRSAWTPALRGHLNVHVWLDWCGTTINDLRRNIHFPTYPDVRLKTKLFHLSHDSHNYGQRVFGYLHPPKTGSYKFAISSDDSSELWLSTDEDPSNSRLIAWVGKRDNFTWDGATGDGQFTKYKSQISKDILLNRGQRYFVEALHKQSSMYDHLLVAWKLPRLGNFSHISSGRISQYIHPNDLHNLDVTRYAQHVPLTPATLQPPFIPERLREAFGGDTGDTRKSDAGSLSKSIRPSLHLKCPYSPSYLVDFNVTRYEGVYLVHETAVFPNDHTHLRHVESFKPCLEGRMVDSHGQRLTDLVDEDDDDDEDIEMDLPTQLTKLASTKNAYQTNEREILLAAKRKTSNLGRTRSASMKDDGDSIDSNKFNKRKILAAVLPVSKGAPNELRHLRSINTSHVSGKQLTSSRSHRHGGIDGDLESVQDPAKSQRNLDVAGVRNVNDVAARRQNVGGIRNEMDDIVLSRAGNGLKRRYGERGKWDKDGNEGITRAGDGLKSRYEERGKGDRDGNEGLRTTSDGLKGRQEQRDKEGKIGNEGLRRTGKYKQRDTTDRQSKQGLRRTDGTLRSRYEQRNTGNKIGDVSSRSNHDASKSRPTQQRGHIHKPVHHQKKRRVVNNKKTKIWRRIKSEEDWNTGISSNLAETMWRLKKSGTWDFVKAYAKEKSLLFTRKTWMYVVWKYLRYHKPRAREKIVEFVYKQNAPTCRTDGNILLNEDVANGVVHKYLKDLRRELGRDFQLKRIVNVEENHDVLKGDRYFLELDLQVNGESETLHLSDYVYLPLGEKLFCSPQDFRWRTDVTVHVIVPVKDLGKWVQHFIDDMSELYQETQDPHVNVIIVDFNSTDIDIEQALARSALKRYQLLKVNGSFQRALGIQTGADAVKNPNDIIFTCDLHLEIPNNMIEIIRKHCVQGKMAFSPMVMRLECGFTPSLPYGEWETMGFGLFAIYKSDFDRIGGMNHEEFKTKWGGEDWEMVDRFLQYQMEIERLRVPRFYHFYHSKNGMWGEYDFEDIVSDNVGRVTEDQFVKPYDPSRDYASRYSYNEPLIPQILMP